MMDKDGIKVTEVIPKEYVLIHRSLQSDESVYGCFQMSAHTSTLLLINHALGIVQVRKIPVGFMTLVKAIAGKMGVPTQDAIQVMAHKDLVGEVAPLSPHDVESEVQIHSRSLQFQALQPPLTRLLEDIKEFLAFFAFQKVAGMPKQLELFGSVGRVTGLEEWLGQYADLSMVVCKESILELFARMERPVGCNLLKGAESNLLTIGRTRFFFTEDKGFISGQELSIRNTPALVKPSESAASFAETGSSSRRKPSRDYRDGGSGRRATRKKTDRDKMGRGGGLAVLLARLNIGKQTDTGALPTLEENSHEQKFAATFILFLIGVLYWGYSEHAMITKRYQGQALSYLSVVDENNGLLKQLEVQEASTRKMGAAMETTKIFWSEKFLALANNMDEHIWLTDVYLSEDERNVAGAKVRSKTMVIEGRLLPSTDGHVRIISEYIDNLLRDSKWFMSDFRDVVFHGAEIEGDSSNMSSDPKIHFVLRAFYDKNKRVGGQKGSGGQAGLGEMHENIDQHNQQLQNALHGNRGR
ncbi:MAG: hypothetical protein HQL85_07185 [Magnetococcales bacterium]|nr:hypothetical protein [Magnetococcales bacterium]